MPGWKSQFALVALTFGVASWLGYRAESRSLDAAGRPEPASRSTARQIIASKSRADSIDRLNALRRVAGRTRLTPREEAQCWEVIRGFSVDDVKDYLAELPGNSRLQANYVLTGMLFYRWAQMDPEAAMREALQPPYSENSNSPQSVVVAWAGRDLDGIMRWAAVNNSDSTKFVVGSTVGRLLALQDPETALARATAECPSAVDGVLLTLTRQMSGDEESRRKLFALLASRENPRERARYLGQLAWALANAGADASLEAVAELEASGVLSDQVDFFRKEVEGHAARQNPQATLERMLRPDSDTPRDGQLAAYASWVTSHPDKAIAWAENHGKVDFIAETVKKQAVQRIASGWQPSGGKPSPWERPTFNQFNTWRKHEPAAAEAWLQTLPSDIRDHFNASSDEATQ